MLLLKRVELDGWNNKTNVKLNDLWVKRNGVRIKHNYIIIEQCARKDVMNDEYDDVGYILYVILTDIGMV